MPVFKSPDAEISYEVHGSGFPLLLFAAGGLRSELAFWRASPSNPMLVLVAFNDDLHPACAQSIGQQVFPLYPQLSYSVGKITAPTALAAGGSFGDVNFTDTVAREFNPETPLEKGTDALAMKNVRCAGVLDDLLFFIDDTDPFHPALAQGVRRGPAFDVVALADDVEDMQIAYGVDIDADNAINRGTGKAASFDAQRAGRGGIPGGLLSVGARTLPAAPCRDDLARGEVSRSRPDLQGAVGNGLPDDEFADGPAQPPHLPPDLAARLPPENPDAEDQPAQLRL